MKHSIFVTLFLASIINIVSLDNNYHIGITYQISDNNSLQDNMFLYCKAKYFSYKYNIPFLYQPFPFVNLLHASLTEKIFDPALAQYSKKISVITNMDIEDHLYDEDSLLFECTMQTETPVLSMFSKSRTDFEEEIKKQLSPIKKYPLTSLASDSISIAVVLEEYDHGDKELSPQTHSMHSKIGKGFYVQKRNHNNGSIHLAPIDSCDRKSCNNSLNTMLFKKEHYYDYENPLKFPPWCYYIEQINSISVQIPDYLLSVTIFTNARDPHKIMTFFKNNLKNKTQVTLTKPHLFNQKPESILEALSAINQYNYFITNYSSFTEIAQLLANASLFIFPIRAITLPEQVIINKINYIEIENPACMENRKVNYKAVTHKIK